MKKLIGAAAAVMMFSAAAGAAMAANNPTVYVNTGEIMFDDQPAVIVNDRTLVPARGVFEAMGAKVEWKNDERMVEVTSKDNKTLIRLTIDDAVMKVYDISGLMGSLLAGQPFQAPETDVTLDVPPQIMSDRTMVPLRAISEAMGADVQWDDEAYSVIITTQSAASGTAGIPSYSLTSSVSQVAEGELVDIYINVRNLPENVYVSSVTATVKYEPDNFEYVGAALINGDIPIDGAMGADNASFYDGYLKCAYVTIDAESAAKSDGSIMKLTFRSKNGKQGSFELSNGYQTRLGFNTTLYVDKLDDNGRTVNYEGDDLYIDKTPLILNNTAASDGNSSSSVVGDDEMLDAGSEVVTDTVDVASGLDLTEITPPAEDGTEGDSTTETSDGTVVLDPTVSDEVVVPQ